ncbi:hypothetical protein [aff. Roholtiella sp. LEGE 12411]|uniref:hypothetical protein n=1 Tax=aff. Roholtiella sp. LEGE 12411 TaxID=1828822 RepID=UPI00187F9AC7|nr:hypothetical protein [aff. Roholtiella sp. LEGE 12411]MBE9036035.1 hypothetical protein [aff. Roholtiella sp. LEGE 12411]
MSGDVCGFRTNHRPAGNFLLSANPFPGCVPLTFSGCASASVTHQAVTLDYAVKVQIAEAPLYLAGRLALVSSLMITMLVQVSTFVNKVSTKPQSNIFPGRINRTNGL